MSPIAQKKIPLGLLEFCKEFVDVAEKKLQVYEEILKHKTPTLEKGTIIGSLIGNQVCKLLITLLLKARRNVSFIFK